MAQYYKFFNSTTDDRRTYQAGDFADYFGSVLSTGLIHTDNEAGMETFVETGTLRTYVTPGKAIMQGHLYENTTNEYLEHSLPESSVDRIDRIVLRLDLRNSERNILLHIKEGDPSESPTAPDLQRDNFIHELSLAQIRVRANTSSLDASDLVDERLDEGLCGLVNSMLTVPTSQFLVEWNSFMDTIRDQSPASQEDLDTLESEVSSHLADEDNPHQTGLLPTRAFMVDDDISEYPRGTTVFADDLSTSGFPSEYGTVITFRPRGNDTYSRQVYIDLDQHTFIRSASANEGWSNWIRVSEFSGSNNDGEWVRFSDGTQICYAEKNTGLIPFSDNGWNIGGSAREGTKWFSGLWSYPRAFINTPDYTSCEPQTSQLADDNSSILIGGTTKYTERGSDGTHYSIRQIFNSGSQGEIYVSLLAIGRWK